jgi:hypothetical protein
MEYGLVDLINDIVGEGQRELVDASPIKKSQVNIGLLTTLLESKDTSGAQASTDRLNRRLS